jgi:ATP-binding cassette, subfamily B (MDR/TAP), member 10
VIGTDGRVAEEGTYAELSSHRGGAFSQLMQWQISGEGGVQAARPAPRPSEEEEIEYDLEKDESEHEHEEAEAAEAEKIRK